MPTIIELRNPNALQLPSVQRLLEQGLLKMPYAAPYGPGSVAEEILRHIVDPMGVLLLGMEAGEPKAFSMASFPSSALFPYPLVEIFYNEGSAQLRKDLAKATMDTIYKAGYAKAWAVNGTGKPLGAWQKTLIPVGSGSQRIGDVVEIFAK